MVGNMCTACLFLHKLNIQCTTKMTSETRFQSVFCYVAAALDDFLSDLILSSMELCLTGFACNLLVSDTGEVDALSCSLYDKKNQY